MTCGACSSSIEKSLSSKPGVIKATVNHITGLAEVTFEAGTTGGAATCRCKTTRHEQMVPHRAAGPRHFVAAVEDCGFEAEVCPPGGASVSPSAAVEEELAQWSKSLTWSLAFTLPVFFLAMVLPMLPGMQGMQEVIGWLGDHCDFVISLILATTVVSITLSLPLQVLMFGFPCVALLKWILVTPVQFWIGARFYRGAFMSLKRGSANMDVLVVLGTSASYIYSVRGGGLSCVCFILNVVPCCLGAGGVSSSSSLQQPHAEWAVRSH